MAVTDDDRLAERLALARNHGEAVVAGMGSSATDVLGFNYRLGELEAAIAEVQLARLEELTRAADRARRAAVGRPAGPRGHPPAGRARGRAATSTTCTSSGSTRASSASAATPSPRRWGRGRAGDGRLRRAAVPPAALPRARGRGVRRPAQRRAPAPTRTGSARRASACRTTRCLTHPLRPRGPRRGRRRRHRDRVPQGARAPRRAGALKLLVAAHDAGGAELLSAWLRRHCAEHDASLVLRRPGAGDLRAPSCPGSRRSRRSRRSSPFDWVLCGSSASADLERRVVRAARAAGVPCTVWLDHWVNYPMRFVLDGEAVLPDELWVSDEHAARIARETRPRAAGPRAGQPVPRGRRRGDPRARPPRGAG